MADVCSCRCAGCRSGTRFIGKQPPLDAVHDHGSQAARRHLTDTKRFRKYPLKNRRKHAGIFYNDKRRDQQIKNSHDRNHNIQHSYRGILSQYNHSRHCHQYDRCINRRNLKCVLKRRRDGVPDHLADAAPADQSGQSKQDRDHRLSSMLFFSVKKTVDIVRRPASPSAVKRILFLIELSQCGLHESSGRSHQRRHPHPENGPCSSRRDCRHHSYQIPHPHAGGSGDNQRLNSRDRPFLRYVFLLGCNSQHFRKQPDRKRPRPYCKINSGRDQNDHQQGNPQTASSGQRNRDQISPQYIVYCVKNSHGKISQRTQYIHNFYPLFPLSVFCNFISAAPARRLYLHSSSL